MYHDLTYCREYSTFLELLETEYKHKRKEKLLK